MAAWRYEFYFLGAKTIFYSLAALVCKILFCHSKIKFISSCHRVISSIYCLVPVSLFHIICYYYTLFFHLFFRADAAASIKRQGYKYLDRCKFLVSSPIFVIVSLQCYTIITPRSNNDPRTYCTRVHNCTTVLFSALTTKFPFSIFKP